MDPLTILALAKGSYEAIKTGVKLGKELQGMFSDVSSLMDSVGKLTQIAAQPPKSIFNKASAEKQAMDAYMAKAEAETMMAEAKNLFIGEFGILAWDEILRETMRIRKEQKAAAAQAVKEQEEFLHSVMVWGSGGLFVLVLLGGMFATAVLMHR